MGYGSSILGYARITPGHNIFGRLDYAVPIKVNQIKVAGKLIQIVRFGRYRRVHFIPVVIKTCSYQGTSLPNRVTCLFQIVSLEGGIIPINDFVGISRISRIPPYSPKSIDLLVEASFYLKTF